MDVMSSDDARVLRALTDWSRDVLRQSAEYARDWFEAWKAGEPGSALPVDLFDTAEMELLAEREALDDAPEARGLLWVEESVDSYGELVLVGEPEPEPDHEA